MNIICVFFGALFFFTGVIFALGRAHIHLKAWREMPPEEKQRIRIVPLCRNIGAVISLCGVILLARGTLDAFTQQLFTWSMLGWFVLAGIDVFFIGRSRFYID